MAIALAAPALAGARNFEHPTCNGNPCGAGDTGQQFSASPGSNLQMQDTPNDPDYDYAETTDEDSVTPSTNMFDENWGFFGFPSEHTRTSALYGSGPNAGQPQISGFNAAGAWKLDRGNPDVTIAILDTGIKWDRSDLRLQIHLNRGELPVPNHNLGSPVSDAASVPACGSNTWTSAYDANGDGAFNVLDYACDDRVSTSAGAHGPNNLLDAEDLIATFSNGNFSGGGKAGGTDDDGNGFVDDIAGWDFFDNDNDPYDASSYFAAGNHGSGRADDAAAAGNNAQGNLGVCPKCQLMPLRIWDTFVADGNSFAMGMTYATDNAASVIEGSDGSVYHSAFAEQASQYAYDHGAAQIYSGDDLNTGDHNYPANYQHAMLIQGTVPDVMGLGMDAGSQFAQFRQGLCTATQAANGQCPGSQLPVATYFRGANTTQYGGKSSISMEGATGSENTGKASGAAGLVISAAKDATPSVTLRPDETREILEGTAERVLTGNTAGTGNADPGADPTAPSEDQWTSHFGWGRVNLGDAVSLAASDHIPPEAAIYSPDWYAPVTGPSVQITALARARFANNGQFHWKLEWGPGESPQSNAPGGSQWHTFASGDSPSTAVSGTVNLSQVRNVLATTPVSPDPAGPTFNPAHNPYQQEFTVRLMVTADEGSPSQVATGIDRRVLTAVDDPTVRAGFPKRMGTGGEAPIRYADVNGDGTQELIVPVEDGTLHMYEPNGSELTGWPVHTQTQRNAAGHNNAPGFNFLEQATPPREPPRGAIVADLDNDGVPEIIDTAGTHLYVWEPDGSLRPGFPIEIDPLNNPAENFCKPADESQPNGHHKCGFSSSPAVGRLKGPNQPLDIVVPALDGHLYAWDGSGNMLNGYPVELVDPGIAPADQMHAESINEPAIGDLNGDGKDDIVVATNETYDAQPPSADTIQGLFGQALSDALAGVAGGSSRVYAVHSDGTAHSGGPFMTGWPIKLNGAIQSTLPFVGPGHNPSIANIGGATRVVASTTGSATIGVYNTDGSLHRDVQQAAYGAGSNATDRSGTVNLFESASIGDLTGSGNPDIVKYGLTVTDLANLLLVGQNGAYNHLIGAYDAESGTPLPGFPQITDDFQFLSSSDIARVDNSLPENQVVAGTGLGLIHAYDGIAGVDVPGFPKVTGGWLFAPAAFSDDGRMADITREGYLFQWNMPNLPKCQSEWPSFRHDQQGTGNYNKDGTPPSTPSGQRLSGDLTKATFKAPGDDYDCGTANRYETVTSGSPITSQNFSSADPMGGAPTPAAAGNTQAWTFASSHKRYVAIRAVDEQGNVGRAISFDTNPFVPPPAGHCKTHVFGTAGNDVLNGTSLDELMRGFAGNDRIIGLGGDDCMHGGTGHDTMRGGNGTDVVIGGPQADRISGGAGSDLILGHDGADRIVGGAGQDAISGAYGTDLILARDGERDTISCGPGHDTVRADTADVVSKDCERVRRP